jgi:patatin-like phospholipase/acyl hydrolase
LESRESKESAIQLGTLDGGGVRGVASLIILRNIMEQVKRHTEADQMPKPCDYFDLTSTGGLIAIMLGRLRMVTHHFLSSSLL